MKTINQIWDSLFKYWQQNEPNFTMCQGAKVKDVSNLENSLGVELPRSLKASLLQCNSYTVLDQKVENSSCLFTGGGGRLFDIEEINKSYQNMNLYKFFGGEALPYKKVDYRLESNITWSKYFIPIYSWNCDVNALIDLRPDSNNLGQILYEDTEFGLLGIWAESYEEFLKSIADAILDHGAFNHDDMKSVRDRINKETRN